MNSNEKYIVLILSLFPWNLGVVRDRWFVLEPHYWRRREEEDGGDEEENERGKRNNACYLSMDFLVITDRFFCR